MNKITLWILICIISAALSCCSWSDTMNIAQNGKPLAKIIISTSASEAEKMAADELAHFLNQITGASFAVLTDDQTASSGEIVLGNTNRLSWNQIPQKLLPTKWEGFTVYSNNGSLYIMGKIPRATLYGVYDMLEQELGCRFLAAGVDFAPKNASLSYDFKSRKYDPPMEYRSIWTNPDETWLVRNRFNSRGENWIPMEEKLGGVRWINSHFVHTFSWLVPPQEFEADHPEYFPLINGKRQGTINGIVTQLCLTNPDVQEIIMARVRGLVEDANSKYAQAKYSKLLVSVSENDNGDFCQCEECKRVNKEEGSPNGGTLIRLVNKIAKEIGKDYPNVEIETLAYGMMPAPPKTKPEKNVVIRWARWIHNGYRLDSKKNMSNWNLYQEIKGWHRVTDRIYHWGYYTNFWEYLAPFPHQKYLDDNIRIMVKNGVVGMFAQNSSDPASEFQQLRSYMLAKAEWRPETDGAQAQKEFCDLYYGKGSAKVQDYLAFLNNNYRRYHNSSDFPEDFIIKGNKMLAEAEAAADSPETKLRVAIARLPIWRMIIERSMLTVGKLLELPSEWKFRFDAEDRGNQEQWYKLSSFSDWKSIKTTDWWTNQGETRRGIGWYAVDFSLPAEIAGRELAMFFASVDGKCDIYIDGVKVGEQKLEPALMWNRPFSIMLPNDLAAGKHTLVIRVEKHEYSAGIYKPVSIVDPKTPLAPDVREAFTRFMEVGPAAGLVQLSEGSGSVEVNYYPVIRSFLKYK